jgi:hypothetical protein
MASGPVFATFVQQAAYRARTKDEFKVSNSEGAKLNGKPCRVLPYDPKWDEND